MQPNDDADVTQYLTFCLADEEYAIGVLRVKEIIEYDTLTRVPQTPSWIRGVINLRGGVVPVVDLAVKLGLGERIVTRRTCIVIVEMELHGERALMGVLADAVSQVVEIAQRDVAPPPAFGTRVHVDYLHGMSRSDKKFILLLDIDRVLSTDELLAATTAGETPGLEAAAEP
jgi:purine-binding chemotaxis protein CheW